jgi:hypothetical protein
MTVLTKHTLKPAVILTEVDDRDPIIKASVHLDDLVLTLDQAAELSGMSQHQISLEAPSFRLLDFVAWLEEKQDQC